MDIASFPGIVSGISLIVSAIFLGGDIHNFINVPGLMIVGGGILATTLLTFQFRDALIPFIQIFQTPTGRSTGGLNLFWKKRQPRNETLIHDNGKEGLKSRRDYFRYRFFSSHTPWISFCSRSVELFDISAGGIFFKDNGNVFAKGVS